MDSFERIDVFISRKSQDAPLAKGIFSFLTERGLNVFESDHTLLSKGNANYSRIIDEALAKAKHFILITSSIQYIKEGWVEHEWRAFSILKNDGQKGNIITIITENISLKDLPPLLRAFEVIPYNSDFKKILPYLGYPEYYFEPSSDNMGRTQNFEPITSYVDEYFDKGVHHFNNKEYKDAFYYFNEITSHPQSMVYLGLMYREGKGVPVSFTKALYWSMLAVENGDLNGYYTVGMMHLRAEGMNENREKALKYFYKSGESGNKNSQKMFIDTILEEINCVKDKRTKAFENQNYEVAADLLYKERILISEYNEAKKKWQIG